MVIYLDLVVILNFLTDLLLLLGTNRLTGFPPDWRRILPGAILGGLYGGVCLLPRFRFLGGVLWRTVFLGLMGWLAFGWNRSGWQRGAVFLLLSLALGGLARGCALIPGAVGIWILCRVGFRGRLGEQEYVPLTITHEGRSLNLVALRDTGNTLKDPITGQSVLVVTPRAAETLLGIPEEDLRHPLEAMTRYPGLRLIPYCSVGTGSGMLLGKRFPDVRLGEKTGEALVAFAPEGLGKNQMYQALTGGV